MSKKNKSHSSSVARSGTFFKASRHPGFFSPIMRKASQPGVQTKLSVSKPADPLEKEADRSADKVMRMPAEQVQRAATAPAATAPAAAATEPPQVQRATVAQQQLQRFGSGEPSAAADVQAGIRNEATGGQALPSDTRSFMEPRLSADLGDVRVHTGETAASLSNHLSARAFTYRNHIFFGRGQYQPGTADGQRLLAHELTHTIQQGATVQRAAAPVQAPALVTTSASPPAVQRLGIEDALDYFADKASFIPGFRMLTLVLGFNPINMRSVARSAANFLRALIELVPGGALITRVLDTHGVINKAAAWVEQKVSALGDVGSAITGGLKRFLDSLSWSDILDLGDVWDRAKRILTGPIGQLISFGGSVVSELLDLVKDAILRPLAALAEGTAGYDLLKAVLGQDPITGDPVPRNADTLIGGFMKLIGQEEIWQNLKRGNAVARAYAWFQGALAGLLGFVRSIPGRVVATIRSLTFEDVVTVVGAFRKVVTEFASLAAQFGSWALDQVISLLEILFSVVAPGALPYIAKARAAFQTILKDPVAFVGNLVRAGKLGFQMFAGNIVTHLKNALIKWLVGPLGEAGVYIPKSFSLIEIIKLVLSVLGLTWQNIRSKLLRIIPEPVLVGLEKTAGVLVTLVTQGPAAAWEQIKAELDELKGQLIGQVTKMIQVEVVKAAVVKLVSMINPAGAVIQAILAIYNTVTFFIEKGRQIGAVVASFIDSISAIAAGQVAGAARKVEVTMANTLTVVIAFLAKFAGLGNIPDKLVGVVRKIRAPIDKGLDKIVDWLGSVLNRFLAAAKQGIKSLLEWWKKKVSITGGDKPHALTFKGERRSAQLVVQSAPLEPVRFMTESADEAKVSADDRKTPIATTTRHAKTIDGLQTKLAAVDDNEVAAAGGAKRQKADADAGALDAAMGTLGAHIGATLAKWKVGDEDVTGLAISRGEFTVSQKRGIAAEARRSAATAQHVRSNERDDPIKVAKGIARRHIVSAYDMGQHYMQLLNNKKASAAKLLLEERGSLPDARTPVAKPVSTNTVKAAAIARYNKFFGYAKNIFLGDSRENSSIQEHLDAGHPEMAEAQLDNHVARIKRSWALDSSMPITPVKKS
ncbi:MAG TPA: DUF4157 domain-containing protein [Microthrixaceae bacterium]|nr:DUF4157 domain-containing protein [Microthrixaceae bacterium]